MTREERLKVVLGNGKPGWTLYSGGHNPPSLFDGPPQSCVMEAAAWIAGEEWTDQPECVSPIIGAFMRRWNDDMDDEGRQRLKPLLPLLLDTTTGRAEDEEKRAWMATDWLVRVNAPAAFRLAELTEQADRLASLPEINSIETATAAQPIIEAAASAAWAAWDARAAWAASAAWAAWDAWDASAARAAWAASAARDASAARAAWAARAARAAWAASAAWDARAAWAASAYTTVMEQMQATVAELQESAVDLVKRMCAVGRQGGSQ
jgi:hypothetical protein